jgi:hypothetical protein
MIMGSGSVGWRSDSGLPGTFSDGDFAAVWSYVTARTAFLSEEDGSVAFLLLPLHHLGELSEELS